MNPKHIDKVPGDRRAIAPYNFVELPNQIVEAEELPSSDRYHLDHHTGKIECTLTTESLLYTRCGWSPEDFAEHGEKAFKDLPDDIKQKRANFFSNPATQDLIVPGSSIRGILRTLVEIVSFSKIDRVTDNKLFYRSLGDPALKHIYQANFVDDLGKVQVSPDPQALCYRSKVHAGFLRKLPNSYIIEECGYGRIDRQPNNRVIPNLTNQPNLPTKPLYQGTNPGKTPSWTYQHQTIYVDIDQSEHDYFFSRQTNRNGKQRHPDLYFRFRKVHSASFTSTPNLQKGTFVITGDMQHKHLEFVFLDEKLKEYSLADEMVRRFQDDDQVTKWQEKAYPKDKPSRGCRQQNGYIRDGEPVFFLLNDDEKSVRFFGRAQMFRLPYEYSPLDFVPPKLKDATCTDIAEAIFGYVDGKGQREKARASRIFITDGVLKPNQDEKIKQCQQRNAQSILLSSPKPTTFQHYLVQPKETKSDKPNLKHYASKPPTKTEQEETPGETVIRGHKLYWHKPAKIEVPTDASDTQTSLIKPIDKRIEFSFTLYFENLSNVELGALLWVLSLSSDKSQKLETGKPGEKYCFSLGMGKPFGMGAVKIDYELYLYELYLSDRTSRYSNLFNGTKWKMGEEDQSQTVKKEQECVQAFEKFMLDEKTGISEKDNPDGRRANCLREIPRIEMLLAMLRCDATPDAKQTRYMMIEPDNEYKDRPVLPTPLDVMRIPDNRRYERTSNHSNSNLPKPIIKKSSPAVSNQKMQSNSPKPKPKNKTDREEGGNGGNLATQRPSNP